MPNVVKSNFESPNLAEMIDRILDKGIVIDAWVKVIFIGIDLLDIEARVVIASLDTYFKYAERIGLIPPETPPTTSPTPDPTAPAQLAAQSDLPETKGARKSSVKQPRS